ncbi:MAG: collagen binding domain-containing protein [Butyrivibrio sp.]
MRKNKTFKLFSVILCLVMTLTLLPVVAKAATGGAFDVKKTDADGNPLAGAVFQLQPVNNTPGQPITAESNEQGIASFTNISDGEYKLTEAEAPRGYIISNDEYDLVVQAGLVYFSSDTPTTSLGESYTTRTFVNRKIPTYQFTVKKTDGSGSPLAGATFSLTGTGNSIGNNFEAVSGNDGIATFDVPEGYYTLAEKTAPAGYIKSDETYGIAIWNGVVSFYDEGATNSNEQYSAYSQVTFVNEAAVIPTYKLTVKKTDENGSPLAGATFSLTGTGNFIGNNYEAVSGNDGIATFDVLEGYYTLAEKTAPAGYIKSDETYGIAIRNGVVYFYNEDATTEDDMYKDYSQVTFVNKAEKASEPADTETPSETSSAPAQPADTQTTPPTGDNSNPFVPAALMLASALAVLGVTVYGKKRKENAE